jgi:hypothetical protein
MWALALVEAEHLGSDNKNYMHSFVPTNFGEDETRRRAKFGTTKYHRTYDPTRSADLIVLKIALSPMWQARDLKGGPRKP